MQAGTCFQLLSPKFRQAMVLPRDHQKRLARAWDQTANLDMELVHAPVNAGGFLDRLVALHPLATASGRRWPGALGRPGQSVAVAAAVQRERARRPSARQLLGPKAQLAKGTAGLKPSWTHVKGERIAGGRRFR